ncbi:hypothetical protein OAN307_c41040 [Octadecabacter antarcticus 307]|uniref:Uncharacterized protein n=1 Tax=Octadecabacter antarcticus 307 TaxID=391626 RepID=M9RCN1_9RHOB|nr:hypothetical protein [Octadecabacter antarcticus]AGI69508.1 hypothetical protein OAN307_c41040 [Octadecabacter antarcticus 307]
MAKLANTTVYTAAAKHKETMLDKTTRIVRKMNDEDAEIRHDKTALLRKSRFESDAETPVEAVSVTSGRTRNKRSSNPLSYRKICRV